TLVRPFRAAEWAAARTTKPARSTTRTAATRTASAAIASRTPATGPTSRPAWASLPLLLLLRVIVPGFDLGPEAERLAQPHIERELSRAGAEIGWNTRVIRSRRGIESPPWRLYS